jgi:hypothetical protein
VTGATQPSGAARRALRAEVAAAFLRPGPGDARPMRRDLVRRFAGRGVSVATLYRWLAAAERAEAARRPDRIELGGEGLVPVLRAMIGSAERLAGQVADGIAAARAADEKAAVAALVTMRLSADAMTMLVRLAHDAGPECRAAMLAALAGDGGAGTA